MPSRPWLLEAQSGGNGMDPAGVFGLLVFIGLIIYAVLSVSSLVGNWFYPLRHTALPVASPTFPVSAPPVRMYASPTVRVRIPTFTPYPTHTPYPTYTLRPEPTPELVAGLFSYYDPMIGVEKPEIAEVNCDRWDYVNRTCLSGLRDESRFEDHYGDTVACDESLYRVRAAYRVVSPEWLKKLAPIVTCRDTGGAVKYPYFDFLLRWQDVPFTWETTPWGSSITLERIK